MKKVLCGSIALLLGVTGCSSTLPSKLQPVHAHNKVEVSFQQNIKLATLLEYPRVLIEKSEQLEKAGEKQIAFQAKNKTQLFSSIGQSTGNPLNQKIPSLPNNQNRISNGYDKNSGLFASLGQYFGSSNQSGMVNRELEEKAVPVVSTVYGGPVTIIKSINGGFGMVLLKKGVPENIHACSELFGMLPEMDIKIIAKSASDYNAYFRPTYWLDRRSGKDKKPMQTGVEFASSESKNEAYLIYASNNYGNSPPANKTNNNNGQANCVNRLQHYNYPISHAILHRLNLLDKRGPFLVAWREDGRRAMVLDMSTFVYKLDFKEAMDTWMKTIVRHPKLWHDGVVEHATFREKLQRMIDSSGQHLLSLLSNSKAQGN